MDILLPWQGPGQLEGRSPARRPSALLGRSWGSGLAAHEPGCSHQHPQAQHCRPLGHHIQNDWGEGGLFEGGGGSIKFAWFALMLGLKSGPRMLTYNFSSEVGF